MNHSTSAAMMNRAAEHAKIVRMAKERLTPAKANESRRHEVKSALRAARTKQGSDYLAGKASKPAGWSTSDYMAGRSGFPKKRR